VLVSLFLLSGKEKSMLRLPIDTTELRFVATTMPEPVVDFTTRAPKEDESGEPLYVVQLVALAAEGGGELITVKTAGAPKNVTPGVFVTVTDLVATPWSMNDRSGVSFKAGAITPAAPAGSSAAKAAS
jgi:hypothetical protein